MHRGVFGTFSHTHPAGVEIHPVWLVSNRGVDGGRPGEGATWGGFCEATGRERAVASAGVRSGAMRVWNAK